MKLLAGMLFTVMVLFSPIQVEAGSTYSVDLYANPIVSNTVIAGSSAVIARVTTNGIAESGHNVRLSMLGGDGSLDSYNNNRYSPTEAVSSINMDKICYAVTGGYTRNRNVTVGAGGFARVEIKTYDTPCSRGYVSSGWYIAKFFASPSTKTAFVEQSYRLQATVTSVANMPTSQVVISNNTRSSDPSTPVISNAIPLQSSVAEGSVVPTILFASARNGAPLACLESTASGNGESTTSSGCNTQNNADDFATVEINRHILRESSSPSLLTNATLNINTRNSTQKNVSFYARQEGTVIPGDYAILYNLGGGAYFMLTKPVRPLTSGLDGFNASWQIDAANESDVITNSAFVSVYVYPTFGWTF